MSKEIAHIKKITIQKFWGTFDIAWELHPDVNILSGINGSGKSTVLGATANLLTLDVDPENFIKDTEYGDLYNVISVVFEDGMTISFTKNYYKKDGEMVFSSNDSNTDDKKQVEYKNNIRRYVDIIKTLDTKLISIEVFDKLDSKVTTSLDFELYKAFDKFLKYKISLGDKIIQALTQAAQPDYHAIVEKINARHNLFFSTVNDLFRESGKSIVFENSAFTVHTGGSACNMYQLSSGEKQLLIILMTVLAHDGQPSIIMLDEPEISLNTEWQEQLIRIIRELNPKAQLIIATHSPSIIAQGWFDRVTEMSDITK